MRSPLCEALARKTYPGGCSDRQGDDITCASLFPLHMERWCLSCLIVAALEELQKEKKN